MSKNKIMLLPIDFFYYKPLNPEAVFIKNMAFYDIFYEIKVIFVMLLTSQPSI